MRPDFSPYGDIGLVKFGIHFFLMICNFNKLFGFIPCLLDMFKMRFKSRYPNSMGTNASVLIFVG